MMVLKSAALLVLKLVVWKAASMARMMVSKLVEKRVLMKAALKAWW